MSFSCTCSLKTLDWENVISKYDYRWPISPPFLKLWSISLKRSLSSQQRHAHRKKFCMHYCDQMIFLVPNSIGKRSLEREHPVLTKFVSCMNSFFFQFSAPLRKFVNLTQKTYLFCQECLVFCQSETDFIIWVLFVSVTVGENFQIYVSVLKCTHTFLLLSYIVHFRHEVSWLGSVFPMSGNFFISTAVIVSLSGYVFRVVSTTWWSQIFDFDLRSRFLLSAMFQLILTGMEKKW